MNEELVPRKTYELIGHESAEKQFIEAWHLNRVPHAWLISGLAGIGKATLAYRIARFVLDTDNKGIIPKGSLFSDDTEAATLQLFVSKDLAHCKQIEAGAHPNLRVLEPGWTNPKTGRTSQNIVIDQVRQSTGITNLTAAGWRVIIIDPVDAMNTNAANALLKSLEEPPSKTLFLLVSHAPGRLLPTIRSRCRRLMLHPLSAEQIKTFLSRTEKKKKSMDGIAKLSGGSIGKALQLVSGNGYDLYEAFYCVVSGLPKLDIQSVHDLSDLASRKNEDGTETFPMLVNLIPDWVGSLILIGAGGKVETEVIVGENELKLRLFEGGASLDRWFKVWEKTRDLLSGVERVNLDRKQVLIECFSMLAAVSSSNK